MIKKLVAKYDDTFKQSEKLRQELYSITSTPIKSIEVCFYRTILAGEKFPWGRTDPKRPSPVLESG